MDITFNTEQGRFNYRVCAIIINEGKLLAMHNETTPYFYLPGGRVKFNETVEEAIVREMQEELNIRCEIVRPLWLNQSFFEEDRTHEKFHEICVYFLVDISKTDILSKGDKFELNNNEGAYQSFEWLDFNRVKEEYLYPTFIKERINNLPENFEILVERE